MSAQPARTRNASAAPMSGASPSPVTARPQAAAACTCGGRSRLPTWSARNGGVLRIAAIVMRPGRARQCPGGASGGLPGGARAGSGGGREVGRIARASGARGTLDGRTVSIGSLVGSGPLILAVPVAAAAGAVTFLSPCCLPLVPGYLSYVTGMSGPGSDGSGASQAGAEPAAAQLARAQAGGLQPAGAH